MAINFRFQTAYFWPSHCWAPENTDYAVYLCKRTMQNKVLTFDSKYICFTINLDL